MPDADRCACCRVPGAHATVADVIGPICARCAGGLEAVRAGVRKIHGRFTIRPDGASVWVEGRCHAAWWRGPQGDHDANWRMPIADWEREEAG